MNKLLVIGLGAFARETIPFIENQLFTNGLADCEIRFTVEDAYFHSASPLACNLNSRLIPWSEIEQEDSMDKAFCVPIAEVQTRARITVDITKKGYLPYSVAAKSSIVYEDAFLSPGFILCSNSVVSSMTRVGSFFHLGFGSYLAHDCHVGDFVTIGPNATICGNVRIGNFVQIGAGAVIKPGLASDPISIGSGSLIGAGAVVTKSIPSNSVVVGNPARPLNIETT